MKDLDQHIDKWSTDRESGFKIRGETFRGRIGLDYELVTDYIASLNDMGAAFKQKWNDLVEAFLSGPEHDRFEAWRIRQREEGNPLTLNEVSLIGAMITEEDAGRPTRASSGSSTGRETSGDGSTGVSSSPDTERVRDHSLSAVS